MTMTRIEKLIAVNKNLSVAQAIAFKIAGDEREVFATNLGELSRRAAAALARSIPPPTCATRQWSREPADVPGRGRTYF